MMLDPSDHAVGDRAWRLDAEARLLPAKHRRAYVAALTAVIVLALVLRSGLIAAAASVGRDAAAHYLPNALAWSEGRFDQAFDAAIPPLYSMLAGLLARLVGDVELACRLVSLAAGMAGVLLVLALGARLFGPWPGLLAAAMAAFHPYQARFSAEVGPDTLTVALLLGTTLVLVGYLHAPRLWRAMLLGALLAMLALSRPEGFAYTVPVLLVMLLFPLDGGRRMWRRRLLHVGLLAAAAAVLCLPRLLWVHHHTGQWVVDTRQVTWPVRLWQAITEQTYRYGQLKTWQIGGSEAYVDSVEAIIASLGPIGLLLGLYAVFGRPAYLRRRSHWVPGLLLAFSILLVMVGCRLSKRYLLAAGALWQPWAGMGLALVLAAIAARLVSHRRGTRAVVVCVVAAAVCAAPLPWATTALKASRRTERLAGEWIFDNVGPGQRIVSRDAICPWYARSVHIAWPRIRRARRCYATLTKHARAHGANLLLVDDSHDNRCPQLAADIAEDSWPHGRVLHKVVDGGRTLTVLQFDPPR